MARKIVNRKALREEVEAAEKADAGKKKVVVAKKTTKRASRSKEPADLRKKVFWGVFNQSLKRIALYEYSDKKEADKRAKDLTASGKSPHFVQPVKEAVQE